VLCADGQLVPLTTLLDGPILGNASFVVFGGKLFFGATVGAVGVRTAHRTRSSPLALCPLLTRPPLPLLLLLVLQNELYAYDATTLTTSLVRDIETGAGSSYPSYLTVMGSKFYFAAYTTAAGVRPPSLFLPLPPAAIC
jgi:ELWxxDGT repeat protein